MNEKKIKYLAEDHQAGVITNIAKSNYGYSLELDDGNKVQIYYLNTDYECKDISKFIKSSAEISYDLNKNYNRIITVLNILTSEGVLNLYTKKEGFLKEYKGEFFNHEHRFYRVIKNEIPTEQSKETKYNNENQDECYWLKKIYFELREVKNLLKK